MLDNKKVILFFSDPEKADNAWDLYKFMQRTWEPGNFLYVWLVGDSSLHSAEPDTIFIDIQKGSYDAKVKSILQYVDVTLTTHTSHKCSTTRFNANHKIINLTHGCGGKGVKVSEAYLTSDLPGSLFDYLLHTGGPLGADYIMKHFNLKDDSNLLPLGYPRNDVLHTTKNRKPDTPTTILWMPTFRQSRRKGLSENYIKSTTGLPLFSTVEELHEFDAFLKRFNCYVDLKLHRNQVGILAHSVIDKELTNLKLIHPNPTSFYSSFSKYAALLTDYSSIYVDFLHMDRPEGFIFSDIREYEASRGNFTYDYKENTPGYHIFTLKDLQNFCLDVINGKDPYAEDRKKVVPKFFKDFDGNSCERVSNFVRSIL